MSNPAVIKLQSGRIGNSKIWMDDNFGESIHIHIDDYRVDLTVHELEKLYSDLCISINELVNIQNFDVTKIDPVFLSVMLWPNLSKLEQVTFDMIRLGEMLAPVHGKIVPLSKSMGVKALQGISKENNAFNRQSNHIGQDDDERLQGILSSIKKYGYPYDDKYIIMYGNDKIIRDGQHRAACLYYLYGDIDVPVMRMHFIGYKSPHVDKYYNNRIRVFFRRRIINRLKSRIRKTLLLLSSFFKKVPKSFVHKKNTIVYNDEIDKIFFSK